MLVEFETIQDLLRCPRTGRPLVRTGDIYEPVGDFEGMTSNISYGLVRGQPLLVDFTTSILREPDIYKGGGRSCIPRSQSLLGTAIKNYLLRPRAKENASRIAKEFVLQLKDRMKRPKVLMVGGGSKGIGTDIFYDDSEIDLICFDVYASSLTQFIADAHQIPLEEASVDGVWIQYVLEHVLDPWRAVSEIYRVLKNDGMVYAETAFMQQVHEGAYDFTRFTHSGHRWLFRHFEELDSGVAMGPGIGLLWTLEHLARGILRSRALGKAAKLAFFWLQYIDVFMPASSKIDNASSVYFMGQKTREPLQPRDLTNYYT